MLKEYSFTKHLIELNEDDKNEKIRKTQTCLIKNIVASRIFRLLTTLSCGFRKRSSSHKGLSPIHNVKPEISES